MSRIKKFIMGTMIVGGLLGGQKAAAQSANTKQKAKTEQVTKQKAKVSEDASKNKEFDKVFRDPGIFVAARSGDLLVEINTEKLSEQVRMQIAVRERFAGEYINEYLKNLDQEDPFNQNYADANRLIFLQAEAREIHRKVADLMLSLPLHEKKYADIKGQLIGVMLQLYRADISNMLHKQVSENWGGQNISTKEAYQYASFVRAVLRAKICYFMVRQDIRKIGKSMNTKKLADKGNGR
ncbi:MAG: hypothetical protein LBF28_02695 [Rickettsiales bacterium]|jgi:hypothetical protein|nr:hypothetical protein [Rickettsiales bacterium]